MQELRETFPGAPEDTSKNVAYHEEDIVDLSAAGYCCVKDATPASRLVATGENIAKQRALKHRAAKDSSQAWTSVNKTLIEDLFDHLLPSSDDVAAGPETVGSRRRSSASGPDDVTDDERKLWRSVAYKWKSNILQRMRSQQVANQPLHSRKRRYAERNVLPNSAYELGVLDG